MSAYQYKLGMAILVPSAYLSDAADYREVLSVCRMLWLRLVQYLLLRHVLHHDYPIGSLYIGNLAVAAEYRNQGIGRQLISRCIAEAKTAFSSIFISVDVRNVRAQKLYESLEFQLMANKTIRLFGTTIGSHILSLSVPNHQENTHNH